MFATVNLFSNKKGVLNNFLSSFYNVNLELDESLKWQKKYANPVELAELIGVYIDNSDFYNLKMFISFDKNVFVVVTENNADSIIRYLYERFPY